MTTEAVPERQTPVQELDRVTIRFCGDSGDGMQLTGTQFTRAAAVFGNDVSTVPDYPAEIRAPAGSLAGVSGFQISFSSAEIHTAGDAPDVLVAMNPAALKANIGDLPAGGALIVNADAFTPQNLAKANYAANPLTDESLHKFDVFEIPITSLNAKALEGLDMTNKQIDLTKNFFALGLMFWLYERSMEPTFRWIEATLAARPILAEANKRALNAGYAFGETTEIFHTSYRVAPAHLAPGTYRQITGNEATAIGLVAASQLARRALFYGSLPDHAGQRHPALPVGVQEVRRQDVPGRGRDRGDGRGDRRRLWRGPGQHRHVRPGNRAQERGDGSRRHDRAAGGHHRRPARRSEHRPAHQDGAGRPAAGDVRPQRRSADAGRRRRRPRSSASTTRSRPRGSRSST